MNICKKILNFIIFYIYIHLVSFTSLSICWLCILLPPRAATRLPCCRIAAPAERSTAHGPPLHQLSVLPLSSGAAAVPPAAASARLPSRRHAYQRRSRTGPRNEGRDGGLPTRGDVAAWRSRRWQWPEAGKGIGEEAALPPLSLSLPQIWIMRR